MTASLEILAARAVDAIAAGQGTIAAEARIYQQIARAMAGQITGTEVQAIVAMIQNPSLPEDRRRLYLLLLARMALYVP